MAAGASLGSAYDWQRCSSPIRSNVRIKPQIQQLGWHRLDLKKTSRWTPSASQFESANATLKDHNCLARMYWNGSMSVDAANFTAHNGCCSVKFWFPQFTKCCSKIHHRRNTERTKEVLHQIVPTKNKKKSSIC